MDMVKKKFPYAVEYRENNLIEGAVSHLWDEPAMMKLIDRYGWPTNAAHIRNGQIKPSEAMVCFEMVGGEWHRVYGNPHGWIHVLHFKRTEDAVMFKLEARSC